MCGSGCCSYVYERQTYGCISRPTADGPLVRQRQVHLFRLDKENKVFEHLAQRDDLGLKRQLTS